MTEQAPPDSADWSFDQIDLDRALKLESCGSPAQLISKLSDSLVRAINDCAILFALDSIDNQFEQNRIAIQFKVTPELYDWFFNSRSGYRAQYWREPNIGSAFNDQIIRAVSSVIAERLSVTGIEARRIHVEVSNEHRDERDLGVTEISREEVLQSLDPGLSKIWICERRYSSSGKIDNIGFSVVGNAAISKERLNIPRWEAAVNPKTKERGEGLRAPLPDADDAWLDVKGGFVKPGGSMVQPKDPKKRACDIHERGWT